MATKYVSSLTGPEMDAALIDMAYHNSEAYAVGTRNGVAVGSGDVTYHNNAKYYAEQTGTDAQAAEAAAARAEAAVPAGTAGAVFFDRAQTLTTAQQSQARANIMAGGSNRNLLDNAYFVGGGSQLGDGVFPINQRGQTSYGASTRAFDRWITESGSSVTLSSNGVTFSGTTVSLFDRAAASYLVGKTVTISAQLGDGTIISGTGVVNPLSQDTMIQAWLPTDGYVAFAVFSGAGSYQFCRIYCDSATIIRAVKLELGTVSTLANDPLPDFGEELRKCQRYLYIPTFPWHAWTGTLAMATSATDFNWVINTPVPMRQGAIPTIGITGSVYINGTAASNLSIVNAPVGNLVKISGTSAGMTNGQLYPVNTSGANISVILSAEP